jgi:hypothetical protein
VRSKLFLHPLLFALGFCPFAYSEDLKLLFYESFDGGKEEGVVGKAGQGVSLDARGKIDLDRGALAFFIKSVKAPEVCEWAQFAGVSTMRGAGYWDMLLGFDMRLLDFVFSFYDVGRYAPPLKLQPCLERWKAGEWHHLAAVWDRNEGVTVYEDGKRAASNWGKHRWEWNLIPETLFFSGLIDEACVYAQPLTDEQVTQLAKGAKPTGAPIPISESPERREQDLARMGWLGESLEQMPVVEAGKPQLFTFARIVGCVDAKRPVSQPFDGFPATTWPHIEYGASLRGQRLDIELAPDPSYDRVRVFVHRKFSGVCVRKTPDGKEESLAGLEAPRATVWHRRLPAMLREQELALKCSQGRLGQIDFYRVEPLKRLPKPKETVGYAFAKAEALPDTELGKALLSETPTRFQQPVLATSAPVSPWTLTSPAFGGFQATTEPPRDAKAFDGALVELVAEGVLEPTPVRIQLKEPVHGMRDWLVADAVLKPKGSGRQAFGLLLKGRPVINMPPVRVRPEPNQEPVVSPGACFGLRIEAANPVTWVMGDGGCSVRFCVTDLPKALPAAADDQVEFMREAYADVMEGHAYGDKRLVIPMKWLAMFAPDRMKFRQMYERVGSPQWFEGINVPKIVYKEPENTTGAPEWAFWQLQAMKEHRRVIHWIIDHQQLWNGEFGGVWNDDTDHTENWICHALAMDDDGKIKDSLRKFWDGLWKYQLEEGISKYTMDTCHFYEEGMGCMGMRLLVDYGDPIAVERAMAASSHYDKWLVKGQDARYLVKSEYVSVNGAWTYGAFDAPGFGGHKANIMIPAGYLLWYNQHPTVAQYFLGWQPTGEFYGSAYDRLADWDAALKRYSEEVLKPVRRYGPQPHNGWIDEIGLSDAIRKAHAKPYQPLGPIAHYWGSRDCENHWFWYRLSGDTRFLVDSYKRVCEWFNSHDWINSGAMPSMDRNPLPRASLISARIGAMAANRGAASLMWPRHAISYVKGADDLAAIVTQNLCTGFSVRLYAFTDNLHDVQIRVWRLHPGKYRVVLASDKNDDGVPEETLTEKEMALDRGAFIDFTLPPRQPAILTVTGIQTQKPVYDMPDPAISPETVELVYNEHLVVRVHNLGTKPVEDVLVRVRDGRSGEPVSMGEQHTGRIEAPLDLKPKHKGLEFKNINCNVYGSIIIELDPDRQIDDLNRHNNRVVLPY